MTSAVLVLLLLIAATSIALAAYSAGLRGNVCRWRMSVFAVILAALMVLFVDFDIGMRGLVQMNQESLASLIQAMEAAMPR